MTVNFIEYVTRTCAKCNYEVTMRADVPAATAEPYICADCGEDTCVECGGDLTEDGDCLYCEADGGGLDGDFPMSMEYEGAYGLSGYDSFYDSASDY